MARFSVFDLHPDRSLVRFLAEITSSSDSHRMGALVATGRQLWKPADLVSQVLGNIPGSPRSVAFQLTSPTGFATRWLQRVSGGSSDARGPEYGAIEAWARDFSALPQETFRQLLFELIRDNRAFRAQLDVAGKVVDLGRLNLPIVAIGGATDRIVAPCRSCHRRGGR